MVKHGGLGKWLVLLCLSSLLAACGGEGGGSFVPDSTDTGNTTAPQNQTPEQSVARIQLSGQSMILSDQSIIPNANSTEVTIDVLDVNGIGVSNAAILVNTDGNASPNNLTLDSGLSGQTTVAVSVPDSNGANIGLTVSSGPVTMTSTLFFGASVSVNESSRGSTTPADGTTPVNLFIRARDFQDNPIEGLPVSLSFSDDSFASATSTSGVTDDTGTFSTAITNQIAQTVMITPTVGGARAETVSLEFTASDSGSSIPDSIDIITSTLSAMADGSESITLNVIVRDQANVPITLVPINLRTDSNTALLSEVIGVTSETGTFVTTLTNTVAEPVIITVATGSLEASRTVNFVNAGATPTTNVAAVTIELSGQNTADADGTDTVGVVAFARDASGNPVVGEMAEIQILNGSAVANPESGQTDSSGRFISALTNEFAETVQVRALIGGIASAQTVSASFRAVNAGGMTTVGTVSLSASPASQPADGMSGIILNALVRDTSGIPISGENVVLSLAGPASGSAALDSAGGPTGAGGSFPATITNTATGSVTITASAQGISSNPLTVNFLQTTLPVASVTVTSTPSDPTTPLLANGVASVILTVIARDPNGTPVPDASVTLLFSANENSRPSSAVPAEGSGMTDAGGRFMTQITDTLPETFTVTARVDSVTGISSPISFLAASGSTPSSIDVTVDRDTQTANGMMPVILTAIARDANNTPIQGVNISLSSTSGSALLSPAVGRTADNGAFMSNITNTQAEAVTITARALPGGLTDSVTVNFEGGTAVSPDEVFINLANNGADADNMDEVTVTVVVRNQGTPVQGATVSLAAASQSAIFGGAGATGATAANGSFVTTLTNSQAETFTLTATSGTASNSINVTFNPSAAPADPSSIQLLSSDLVLLSEGEVEGVTLTAILRTANNNPFVGGQVTFIADSGVIQAIPVAGAALDTAGITNTSGVALARLTTAGNSVNRPILVTATSGNLSTSLTIEVQGTALNITGPDNAIIGGDIMFSIFLRDSSGAGIPNQALSISSQLGNTISPPTPVTDSSGRAEILVTASNAGPDELTVNGAGADQVVQMFTISNDNFCVIPMPDPRTNTNPSNICDPALIPDTDAPNVPLNTDQFFTIHWDRAGIPQPFEDIMLSATRGMLSIPNVNTNSQGEAGFSIRSDNAGPVTLTVGASAPGGPSTQLNFSFIADNPASIDLQASPSTLGVNTPGSNASQSEIVAIVRDAENNLVQGRRVEFTLTDITGGSISPSSALTDNFGRASTVYTAGASPSASNGVTIEARVTSTTMTTIMSDVSLTVAQRAVFVTLGTGNEIMEDDLDTRYMKPYTLLVNDVNGVAVENAQVTLSVLPTFYSKGTREFDMERSVWVAMVTVTCPNEDINNNGILDVGEDTNGSGRLEPGNVATVERLPNTNNAPAPINADTVVTNGEGFADFFVTYPQENASWVDVRLTARTLAAGSEEQDEALFTLGIANSDIIISTVTPPGTPSPFGTGSSCGDTL